MKSKCHFASWNRIPLLVFSILIASACASEDPMPANTPSVSGTVSDLEDGFYENVEVTLLQSGSEVASVNTDASGEFLFSNLMEDAYEIAINPPLTTSVMGDNPIALAVGNNTTNADFTLNLNETAGYIIGADLDPYGEIKNSNRQDPQDHEEIFAVNVFSNGNLIPIYAPDGHQLTFSEWKQAQGTARFSCKGNTTYYQMEFTGLIPNGVYTVWISPLLTQKTAQSVWSPSTEILGLGALGGSGGTKNIVVANQTGEGELEGTMNSGSLTNFGELSSCALTSAKGIALILDYHIDGKTYGNSAGPDSTEVGHMIFLF